MKAYTRSDLKKFDGTEGRPTFVAIEGKVYDLTTSRTWKSGIHYKTHKAGDDLTAAIKAAPHGTEVLDQFEQVGSLVDNLLIEPARQTPRAIELFLSLHPHPMTIHFPIALSNVASLFILIFLIFGNHSFETFAIYSVIMATITAPITIFAGLLSWIYNYSAVWTPIYRTKIICSIILLILQTIALITRLLFVNSLTLSSPAFCLYALSVLAMAPTVIWLGYTGGKITFPS